MTIKLNNAALGHARHFNRLHRCAVLAVESRAAQHDHPDIAKAARALLDDLGGD